MNYRCLELAMTTNGLATVWLNRPEVRNAFNDTLIAELTDVFQSLSVRDDVRVLVLAARGTVFCAGADLNWMKQMADYSVEENRADAARLAAMLNALYRSPHPVVARIQGDCYAGGMGLAAACDIRIASEAASFCLSEVKLGLAPATISPYVIEAMGVTAARRYFVTAERFDAAEALRIGFIHERVPAEGLDARLAQLIDAMSKNGPQAMREAKRLVREVAGRAVDEPLMAETADWIARMRAGQEGKEGVRSFLEKRTPSWVLTQ